MNQPADAKKIDHTVRNADHEVIYPKNELRARVLVRTDGKSIIDEAAIARASNALAGLSDDFEDWMNDEIGKLVRAYETYSAAPANPDTQLALFRQAHDLKGNAAMLGYPPVGEAAHSLARLLDALPPDSIPTRLVASHVQSIRALTSRAIGGPENRVALELVSELRSQTNPVIDAYQEAAKSSDVERR